MIHSGVNILKNLGYLILESVPIRALLNPEHEQIGLIHTRYAVLLLIFIYQGYSSALGTCITHILYYAPDNQRLVVVEYGFANNPVCTSQQIGKSLTYYNRILLLILPAEQFTRNGLNLYHIKIVPVCFNVNHADVLIGSHTLKSGINGNGGTTVVLEIGFKAIHHLIHLGQLFKLLPYSIHLGFIKPELIYGTYVVLYVSHIPGANHIVDLSVHHNGAEYGAQAYGQLESYAHLIAGCSTAAAQ